MTAHSVLIFASAPDHHRCPDIGIRCPSSRARSAHTGTGYPRRAPSATRISSANQGTFPAASDPVLPESGSAIPWTYVPHTWVRATESGIFCAYPNMGSWDVVLHRVLSAGPRRFATGYNKGAKFCGRSTYANLNIAGTERRASFIRGCLCGAKARHAVIWRLS